MNPRAMQGATAGPRGAPAEGAAGAGRGRARAPALPSLEQALHLQLRHVLGGRAVYYLNLK